MSIKLIAIIVFIIILASLASALFHLVKAKTPADSAKILKALTLRISLSVLVFIGIFIAFATGLLEPHGIGARIEQLRHEQATHNP
jgi:hypothetical protein